MLKRAAVFTTIFLISVNCQAPSQETSELRGYENTRRQRVSGLASFGNSKNYKVTGRLSMGTLDPNQCEAAYAGSERVAVTYSLGGQMVTQSLFITGVNNADFGTSQNGVITNACGTVVEAAFFANGKSHVERFVVVDRIYEGHAQAEPNLDIAVEAFQNIRRNLSHNDNFYQVKVTTIGQGSFRYAQNSDCTFSPTGPTPCGDGW